jgi:hypothetical protein
MRKGLTFIGSLAAAAAMITAVGPLVESRPANYPKRRSKKLPRLQIKTSVRVNKAYRLKGVRP